MFTQNEVTVLMDFLDRVTLTGHQERAAMNALTQKIMSSLAPAPTVPAAPAAPAPQHPATETVVKKAARKKSARGGKS